jgi:hypothetical protein
VELACLDPIGKVIPSQREMATVSENPVKYLLQIVALQDPSSCIAGEEALIGCVLVVK